MTVEVITYERGGINSPFFGRLSLHLFPTDSFLATYQQGSRKSVWRGDVAKGTFEQARACMEQDGFLALAPLNEYAPDEYPLELGWCSDGAWHRGELRSGDERFLALRKLASSILSVLDAKLARMPPGGLTPVLEQHRTDSVES